MRKNKIHRKKLNLYTTYKITGLNTDNLVNILQKKGITLKDVKKKGNKTLFLAVNSSDNEKFFAITRDLCYNIKKVGERGVFRLISSAFNSAGLLIGAFVFVIVAALSSDFVFSVDFRGSGKVYSREISEYLKSQDVGKFSRFSEIDLAGLSDGILAFSDKISFAECVKRGNRLIIELVQSVEPVKVLGGDKEALVSDVDGEVEYLKVYRGTAEKSVGDKVVKGETVCSGYAVIKDTVVKVGVIATVSIKAEYLYTYLSEKDGEEDIAVIFAEAAFGDGEILGVTVDKKTISDANYQYNVKLVYRRLLYG